MKILFFDDDKISPSNILLAQRILLEMPDNIFKQAHSFSVLETYIQKGGFDVIILDIMGAENNVISLDTKNKVKDDFLGVEMLWRIREGLYPNQKSDTLIIMRSARELELEIKDLCYEHGTNHFFAPGNDDEEIINILKEKAKTIRA